ncbi:MAG TPA: hypothetical protein VEL11_06185 [Candidatus Bathyarchaeia archaeon]|nr:hypothetical protein [Candidatus Bathyarchaeia archaeon]
MTVHDNTTTTTTTTTTTGTVLILYSGIDEILVKNPLLSLIAFPK